MAVRHLGQPQATPVSGSETPAMTQSHTKEQLLDIWYDKAVPVSESETPEVMQSKPRKQQ